MNDIHGWIKTILEDILLVGGALMAVFYGLRRIYCGARNIEKLLEYNEEDKKERLDISTRLKDHILSEEIRDQNRDKQLIELMGDVKEITREIRPNGGSSMKDQIGTLVTEQGHIKERMAGFEQWKKDRETA